MTTAPMLSKDNLPGAISVLNQVKLLQMGKVVHMHIKIVYDVWLSGRTGLNTHSQSPRPTIDELVYFARMVYAKYGISIIVDSIERLDLPLSFNEIEAHSDKPYTLFDDNKNFVKEGDLVVFFIFKLSDSGQVASGETFTEGVDDPRTIVAIGADKWTLAHELGHALGIDYHAEETLVFVPFQPPTRNKCPRDMDPPRPDLCKLDRIMTCCGANLINVPSPILSDEEVSIVMASDLIKAL
jgi:hypothetical protein